MMTQARPYREKKKMPEVRRGNAGVSDGSAATRGIFLCQNTFFPSLSPKTSFYYSIFVHYFQHIHSSVYILVKLNVSIQQHII